MFFNSKISIKSECTRIFNKNELETQSAADLLIEKTETEKVFTNLNSNNLGKSSQNFSEISEKNNADFNRGR